MVCYLKADFLKYLPVRYNFSGMDMVLESINNYKVLAIPAGAWFVAQALKMLVILVRDKKLDISSMVSMGGMPSSHSATVCALATTLAMLYGFDSAIFAIAVFFAIVVMYDAAGVRQTVGNQSNILNKMLDELFKGSPAFEERLKEVIGHSWIQVIAGASLGIVLAWWWI